MNISQAEHILIELDSFYVSANRNPVGLKLGKKVRLWHLYSKETENNLDLMQTSQFAVDNRCS